MFGMLLVVIAVIYIILDDAVFHIRSFNIEYSFVKKGIYLIFIIFDEVGGVRGFSYNCSIHITSFVCVLCAEWGVYEGVHIFTNMYANEVLIYIGDRSPLDKQTNNDWNYISLLFALLLSCSLTAPWKWRPILRAHIISIFILCKKIYLK